LERARVESLVKSGSQASLKELFEHYYGKIFATVMALVRNREWAEDLTQESFYRAFTKLESLREPAKFGSWIAAIATNLALDSLKKEKKSYPTPDFFEDGSANPSGFSPVEERVLRNEKVELVRAALRTLPPEQYQVIILHYYHYQTIEDMALFLGVKAGTIKSRMHRARKKLLTVLEDREQNETLHSLSGEMQNQDVEVK
jgi:RNA polymerase sigma-70 factor (ECF subfamily)